jgi:hypothetical protein
MIRQQHTSSTVIQGDENYSTTITGDHVNGQVGCGIKINVLQLPH